MQPTDWIGAIAGAAGVLVAIGALVVAVRANGRSRVANKIAAKALEVQQLTAPPAWSAITRDGDYGRVIRNTSGKHIIVRSATASGEIPDSVDFPRVPARVENGDDFRFMYAPSYDGGADVISIGWTYEYEDRQFTTERRL